MEMRGGGDEYVGIWLELLCKEDKKQALTEMVRKNPDKEYLIGYITLLQGRAASGFPTQKEMD
jgi:hypothetical protein